MDKNFSDATMHINEESVTQPYAPTRCWFQLGSYSKKEAPKFCQETRGVASYWVTRPANGAKLRSTCSATMSVCPRHVKSLKRSGYEVTKVGTP